MTPPARWMVWPDVRIVSGSRLSRPWWKEPRAACFGDPRASTWGRHGAFRRLLGGIPSSSRVQRRTR
eukprot:11213960-Lingulodinium_polyedra.AAC.1